MSKEKETYIAFANAREDLRIYNKPFWLDAVCGPDCWDAVVVEDHDGIAAAVPYHKTKDRHGIPCLLQPQLTQCFDIWTRPLSGIRQEKALSCRFSWIGEIAKRMLDTRAEYYQLMFSSGLDNWEPFCWEGFHQQTRYTFVIGADQTGQDVWAGLNSTMKRRLRHVPENVRIEELHDPQLLYRLQSNALSRRGIAIPFSEELVERVYRAGRDHSCAKMLAVKENGEIRNAGLYVFDRNYVYELLLGASPETRPVRGAAPGRGSAKGAVSYKSLMTYEMIRFAGETGRGFDFEGSMVRSIAEHNRRFGAVMVPYHQIWKINTNRPLRRRYLERLSLRHL